MTQRPEKAFSFGSKHHHGAPHATAKPKWPLLAMAGVGGAVVGGFVPMGLVESVSAAVGLAELVPALAPPLGGTMRAVLVAGGGVSALALAAAILGPSKKSSSPARRSATHHDTHPEFNGDTPMGHPHTIDRAAMPNVRAAVRAGMSEDDLAIGGNPPEQGGFFARIRQSMSKLPLPRRFDDDDGQDGPIRDFSDLKRLRSGADKDDGNAREAARPRTIRPIAAHAELGEPLPPTTSYAEPPTQWADEGDDFDAMEKFAALAAERNPQAPVAMPIPTLSPTPLPKDLVDSESIFAPAPSVSSMSEPLPAPQFAPEPVDFFDTPDPTATDAPKLPMAKTSSRNDDSIEALVERLEHALHHARQLAAGSDNATPANDSIAELDLAEFAAEQERAAEEQARAEAEERRRVEALAEAEERRRAEILAAQEAAKRAAEEADRAAEEARRRADDAQKLLASLGVAQAGVADSAPVEAASPLRAVPNASVTEPQPEMDEALRSALRTLRRMGSAN